METARFKLLKKLGAVRLDSLKQEIAKRGLSLAVVHPYLKQAYILDSQLNRNYTGFAIANNKDGYNIEIPNALNGQSIKACIGEDSITIISGGTSYHAQIYYNIWDFLNWLQKNKRIEEDTHIILNTTSNVEEAVDFVKSYKNRIGMVVYFAQDSVEDEYLTYRLAELLEPLNIVFGTKKLVSLFLNDQI